MYFVECTPLLFSVWNPYTIEGIGGKRHYYKAFLSEGRNKRESNSSQIIDGTLSCHNDFLTIREVREHEKLRESDKYSVNFTPHFRVPSNRRRRSRAPSWRYCPRRRMWAMFIVYFYCFIRCKRREELHALVKCCRWLANETQMN